MIYWLKVCLHCGRESENESVRFPVYRCKNDLQVFCDECGEGDGKKCPACGEIYKDDNLEYRNLFKKF